MVSNKFLFAIILLYVYIGVQSLFYFFGGVVLTILVAMAFLNGPRLLDWANSPPHLQFNKYVLTGYRPISSVQDCIRSLFYMHNELGNIYTHAGDGSFPYGAQQLGLGGGDGRKSAGKYGNGGLPQGAQQGAQPYRPVTGGVGGGKPPCKNGNGGGYGAQPAGNGGGYGAQPAGYGQGQLGAGQSAPYSNGAGGKESKYGGGGLNRFFGNGGYKG